MEYKTTIKKILLISLGIFLAAILFGVFAERYNDFGLYWATTEVIQQAPGFFSIAVFFVSIILFFLREEVFRSWLRFAKRYLLIAAVLIIWSAVTGSSGGWGMPSFFDSELVIWWTAGLFLVISLLLIIIQSLRLRR